MPPIRCKCQQEIYDQEEARRKLSERQAEIKRMKASGLQDKSLYDYTFEKDAGINPEMHLAHKYVENWDDMKARSSGLLLWGDVGTGRKSTFTGKAPARGSRSKKPKKRTECQNTQIDPGRGYS